MRDYSRPLGTSGVVFAFLAKAGRHALLWSGCLGLAWALTGGETMPEDTNLVSLTFEQLLEIKVDSVVGASRYEQKISQAPSAITVISGDEIQKMGHRTLTEVLKTVPGVYANYDRNYDYLGMRGFNRPGDYTGRILLLINGHRANDALYDSASTGKEFTLDVDLIERVEVIRGPGASMYGNNAVFGVVNVITRGGKEINGAEASAEAASWDSYKGRFSFGKVMSNGVELVVSGTVYESEGKGRLYFPEYDTPGQNYGVAERGDWESARQFFMRVAWQDLSLEGAYARREKGIPTGSYGMDFNNRRNSSIDERPYLELKYEHNFEEELDLTARVYFDHSRYQGYYVYSGIENYDDAVANWWGANVQARRQMGERLTLVAGTEFNHYFQQDQMNYDVDPYLEYLSSRRSSANLALYGQADWFILTNLIFSAGVRFDHHSRFGNESHPRLALIWSPWEATTVKWLYGSAYRAPNTYESDYLWMGYKNNPALGEERIRTYEMVLEQKLGRRVSLSLSGYYYEMDGLISQQVDPADGLIYYGNLANVKALGLETAAEVQLPAGWRWRASYALQRTRDAVADAELTSSPRHLAKANLIIPWYKDKLYSGLEVQYSSSMGTLGGQRTKDYVVANLTLYSHRLAKGLDVSASIYNLFDTHYGNPGAVEHLQDIISQDGRNFRLKLTYHF